MTMRLRGTAIACLLLAATAAQAELRKDIEFARPGGVSLTLDAWVPEGTGPFPAVIIVHGGGFEAGDKTTYVPPLFEPLTRGGFAWFTINYRLAPKFPFPAAIEDCESAIRWVKANAAAYKVDPRRIALMGESAGGHIVAFAGAKFTAQTRVNAVVPFYGPVDLLARAEQEGKVNRNIQQFLALPEPLDDTARVKLREASPITHVNPRMPPFLMIHGTQDKGVPLDQSERMCAAMTKAGVACEIYAVAGAPHGIGNWEKDPAFQTYKQKMVEWLHATLGK
jgi:alpha-L-fucosidase 2